MSSLSMRRAKIAESMVVRGGPPRSSGLSVVTAWARLDSGAGATGPVSWLEGFDACKSAITSVIEAGRSSGLLAIIFW